MNALSTRRSGGRFRGTTKIERHLPAWFDDFSCALSYASHIACTGNTGDLFPDPDGSPDAFASFEETVRRLLNRKGVRSLLIYDPIRGLRLCDQCDSSAERALAEVGIELQQGPLSLRELAEVHRLVVTFDIMPIALLLDYASHITAQSPEELTEFFVAVHKASRDGTGIPNTLPILAPRFNPTIWVVDRIGDLPGWFVLGNPSLHEVSVELPDLEDRFLFAKRILSGVSGCEAEIDEEAAEQIQRFALECDGELLRTMLQILRIARSEGLGINGISDAVRAHRTGVRRNPWTSPILRERIRSAPERLGKRVLGQQNAIEKTLDILARSIMGLSGAQDGRRHKRPRGVLFFAGPTGVGKTELAKSVTELLFGDDAACHRFDMSEFMEESAVTRLIGAPPGQPGHDRGGELVNAVRRRPFSVLLFDEVEKAHPRILDIFLQILDEGRLTDARGATGHFSEALVIFTSNIGMIGGSRETNMGLEALPSDAYRQLDEKISQAVHAHFRVDLKRPELVNRIGQNIVVFDFLRYDSLVRVFDAAMARVISVVEEEHGIRITLDSSVRRALCDLCTHDVFDGGRGVGNRIETHFVNPLARTILEEGFSESLHIDEIRTAGGHTELGFFLGTYPEQAEPTPKRPALRDVLD